MSVILVKNTECSRWRRENTRLTEPNSIDEQIAIVGDIVTWTETVLSSASRAHRSFSIPSLDVLSRSRPNIGGRTSSEHLNVSIGRGYTLSHAETIILQSRNRGPSNPALCSDGQDGELQTVLFA
jgi:hypothetical protein